MPPTQKVSELSPPPSFIADREALWQRVKAERKEWLEAQVPEDIVITLPDGKEVLGQSWRTTPYEVAAGISKGLGTMQKSAFAIPMKENG